MLFETLVFKNKMLNISLIVCFKQKHIFSEFITFGIFQSNFTSESLVFNCIWKEIFFLQNLVLLSKSAVLKDNLVRLICIVLDLFIEDSVLEIESWVLSFESTCQSILPTNVSFFFQNCLQMLSPLGRFVFQIADWTSWFLSKRWARHLVLSR